MPLATSYTESQLAAFMEAEVGPYAGVLGWTTGSGVGSYAPAVNATLRSLGAADIATATDTAALEKVAAREAWRRVVKELGTSVDVKLGDQSISRSQRQQAALRALALAEQEAAPYDTTRAAVTIHSLARRGDPYAVPADVLEAAGVAVGALP